MKTLLTLVCLLSLPTFASTYYIQDPKLIGVTADEGLTTVELVGSALQANRQTVVTKDQHPDFTIRPRMVKLGSAYLLTFEKWQGSEARFTAQAKADRFDEMDNMAVRIARSLINEVPVEKDARVGDVTADEATKGTRRQETVNRYYLGIGPGLVSGLNSAGTHFNIGLGYYLEIDPEWALKIVYDATGANFGYFGLGANYYFQQTRSTPVVTADFGYGWTLTDTDKWFSDHDPVSGFVLGGGIGYVFFRTSKVNLEILAHSAVMLNSNRIGTPAKYGLRVGLYF